MISGMVKKLIIVSGDKESVYAELLSSLISIKDDNTDNNQVVGIKDGNVEAVVWNEKLFNDNKIQLSSKAKVIFVGKTKATEPYIASIRFNKELEKYGVKLGWLGSKAVIYTEPDKLFADQKLYDEFYDSYIELSKKYDDTIVDTEAIKKAKHSESLWDTLGKSTHAVGDFFGGLFSKKKENELLEKVQATDELAQSENVESENTHFFDFGAKIEAGNLIPDQLFRFAILDLYMNKLSKFLGICNE